MSCNSLFTIYTSVNKGSEQALAPGAIRVLLCFEESSIYYNWSEEVLKTHTTVTAEKMQDWLQTGWKWMVTLNESGRQCLGVLFGFRFGFIWF